MSNRVRFRSDEGRSDTWPEILGTFTPVASSAGLVKILTLPASSAIYIPRPLFEMFDLISAIPQDLLWNGLEHLACVIVA
jgi:hypothetical protein